MSMHNEGVGPKVLPPGCNIYAVDICAAASQGLRRLCRNENPWPRRVPPSSHLVNECALAASIEASPRSDLRTLPACTAPTLASSNVARSTRPSKPSWPSPKPWSRRLSVLLQIYIARAGNAAGSVAKGPGVTKARPTTVGAAGAGSAQGRRLSLVEGETGVPSNQHHVPAPAREVGLVEHGPDQGLMHAPRRAEG